MQGKKCSFSSGKQFTRISWISNATPTMHVGHLSACPGTELYFGYGYHRDFRNGDITPSYPLLLGATKCKQCHIVKTWQKTYFQSSTLGGIKQVSPVLSGDNLQYSCDSDFFFKYELHVFGAGVWSEVWNDTEKKTTRLDTIIDDCRVWSNQDDITSFVESVTQVFRDKIQRLLIE